MESKSKKVDGSFWILGKKRISLPRGREEEAPKKISHFRGERFEWLLTICDSEASSGPSKSAVMLLKPKTLGVQTELQTNIRFGGLLENEQEPIFSEKQHNFTPTTMSCKLELHFPFEAEYKWVYCGIEILDDIISTPMRMQIQNDASFIADLQQLLHEEETKDVTIVVGDRKHRAHKIILTSRSPVFKGMFNAKMKEQDTGVVTISELSYECVAALLEFIYTNDCSIDLDMIEELLHAADMYDVSGLKAKCGAELLKNIEIDNALEVYASLERYQVEPATKQALAFIIQHAKKILQLDESRKAFEQANPNLAAELYHNMLICNFDSLNFE